MALDTLHKMKAVLIEFVCPDCKRKVRVNPSTNEILSITPGDDSAAHEMSVDFWTRSLVLPKGDPDGVLCPV